MASSPARICISARSRRTCWSTGRRRRRLQLVVKQNGVQSDGSTITVDANYLKEYSRVMTTNPITGLEWDHRRPLSGVQIGVKNNKDTTGFGVGFSDIVLECR